jgi:mannose-1-phosphate guanylyltransferase/mannose-6-phosphate isomerase
MTVPEDLVEILRCIECHERVEERDAVLVCVGCGLHYPIEDGIPVMLPESAFRPDGSTVSRPSTATAGEGHWSDGIVDDERPWGRFRRYSLNESSTVKIITVDPRQRLSEQRHQYRDELWVVLDDGVVVEIDGDRTVAAAGDEFFVRRGSTHRMSSSAEQSCRVLEIAFGEFDEDDIERLSDEYGRSAT